MTSHQRQLIRRLIGEYAKETGTESTIAFVAETNGLLSACQALLQTIDREKLSSAEWLQFECSQYNVPLHSFLQDITQVVALFKPTLKAKCHYDTLGLGNEASLEEVKLAYRTLSRQYHPDTASSQHVDNSEKFIEITNAYRTLLELHSKKDEPAVELQGDYWRKEKKRVPFKQKAVFLRWAIGVIAVLIVVSIFAANGIRKRAMLAGLKENRIAFVPPVETSVAETKRSFNSSIDDPVPTLAPVAKQENREEALVDKKIPEKDPTNSITEKNDIVETSIEKESASVATTAHIDEGVAKKQEEPPQSAPLEKPVQPAETIQQEKIARSEDKPSVEQDKPIKQPDSGQPAQIIQEPIIKRTEPGAIPPLATPDTVPVVVAQKPRASTDATVDTATAHISESKTATIPPEVVPAVKEAKVEEPTPAAPTAAEASVPQTITTTPEKADEKPQYDLQTGVKAFLDDYVKAYEKRNVILFSRFFEADATENGALFKDAMSDYLDLFAKTSRISLKLENISSSSVDDRIDVRARFTVSLHFKNGHSNSGSGPIHFLMSKNDGKLLISEMDYTFK